MEEASNANNQNPNYLKKNLKFLSIVILGVISFLLTFSAIQYFFFQILKLVFYYKPIAIFGCVLVNYLLVRYIILSVLFPGGNFLFKKFLIYENGKIQAKQFHKLITTLKSNLCSMKTSSLVKLRSEAIRKIRSNLKQTIDAIKYYINVYENIKIKFKKLSKNQTRFLSSLRSFSESVEASGINYIIQEAYENINNFEDDFDDLKTPNLDRHLTKIVSNVDSIEIIMNEYLFKKSWGENVKNFWINDIFGSVEQMRIEMYMNYDIEEYLIQTKDKKYSIEVLLLKSENKENLLDINSSVTSANRKNLMIICGPNGVPFENYSRNMRLHDLYLEHNIDVLLWNYRGFGINKGLPSFKNIKSDSEEILQFAKGKNKWEKIGVYGLSMGGIACCHIGSTNLVDVCIADRTFSSIDDIVINFTYGPFLHKLYRILLFEQTNNVINFLNTRCDKMLLCDPQDNIINDSASLKTGISKRAINHLLKNKTKAWSKLITHDNDKSILHDILEENELNNFKQSMINLVQNIKSIEKAESSKKFFEMQNLNKKQEIKIFSEGTRYVRLDSPKNFDSNSHNSVVNTSLEEEKTKSFNFLKVTSKEIINILSDFESAGDSLSTLSEIKLKRLKENFIENFFNNLLIWGCAKTNVNENSEKIMSHDEIFIKLKFVLDRTETILSSDEIKNIKYKFLVSDLENFFNVIKKVRDGYFKIIFNGELNFDDDHTSICSKNKLNVIEKFELGILLPICCGHNGALSEAEFYCLKYELYRIKFITS